MLNQIPTEIIITVFSVIGILTGYVWNAQSRRISRIEEIQYHRPCVDIERIVVELRTDIKWIKQKISKIN
jgi:hypothetical protein